MTRHLLMPAAILTAAFLLLSCGEEKPQPADAPKAPAPDAAKTTPAAPKAALSLKQGYRIVEYMSTTCPWCHKLKNELEILGADVKGGLNVEYVNLDKQRERIEEATEAGFKGFVPYLVIYDGNDGVATTLGGYATAQALKDKFVEAGALQ